VGAERIFAIMDTPAEADEGTSEAEIEGRLDFSHVVFSYKEGEPVLKDFDLWVKRATALPS
jgi:ATP-binding cassette subfamily B protein